MADDYVVGHLDYMKDYDRYGLVVDGMWVKYGFHNGEPLEVLVDGEWVQSCMFWKNEWCLFGTPYSGNLFGIQARIRRYSSP